MPSTPLSNAEQKHIRSLGEKKFRQEHRQFIVEGAKICAEVIRQDQYPVSWIAATENWLLQHEDVLVNQIDKCRTLNNATLNKISQLNSPNEVLIVLDMPRERRPSPSPPGLVLALDGIRDPGNMGTLTRIADWFGIEYMICSNDCADPYNPKAVQASMGSFLRVQTHLCELPAWLARSKKNIIGAVLGGQNMYDGHFPKDAVLVIGSESHGISAEVMKQLSHQLTIPRIGQAESLNAAVATGIICAWLNR